MNKALRLAIVKNFNTQTDFARALRVHEPTVSRVIRGRERLSPSEEKRWAKALNADPGELFPSEAGSACG